MHGGLFGLILSVPLLLALIFYSKINLKDDMMSKLGNEGSKKFAYASLLCDDVMIDATKVLIHSLKKTGTPHPIILLILPQVKQTDDLMRLGAELHLISPLDYPFKVNAEKTAINKMCRYSKLHIWKFTQYKKIIFIDVDTLITQSLDEAFEYPQFSAVRDAGDTFNTGLFVLEPSLQTWRHMLSIYFNSPSYNQGDQGFLNWYFRNSTKLALPVKYNTVCKHKSNAMWPLMKRQAKMIHYTSETKPWTFFAASHRFWKQNFEASLFYLWSRAFREVTRELEIDIHDVVNRGSWYNANRARDICELAYQKYHTNSLNNNHAHTHMQEQKLTVIIHKWKTTSSLEDAIYYYRKIIGPNLVERIYVYWNPKLGIVPPELTKYRHVQNPSVEIVKHRYESPNNLWNPLPHLSGLGAPVFFADDSSFPELEKLEIARETWRNNPWSLVGFFPRYHYKQLHSQVEEEQVTTSTSEEAIVSSATLITLLPTAMINAYDERYRWTFNLTSLRRPRPYTLISPSLLLVNSEYLFAYTCLLPERIHRFVDDHAEEVEYGGADLAMNLLAQGMSGQRPMVIKNGFPDPEKPYFSPALDLANGGTLAGSSGNYAVHKGKVLQELCKFFTNGKDILQANSLIVSQYNKIPFKKKSMKRWNDPT